MASDAPLRKLMIVPWTGPLPRWIDAWRANTRAVSDAGYGWDFLLDDDLHGIIERIEALGVAAPRLQGRKLCDFRPALGEIYAAELNGYDFWGHTDLDCVYGRLWDYVTDDLLADCDIYSNDPEPWMCGPFSLYRTDTASHVFRLHTKWQEILEDSTYRVFDERGISGPIAASGLRVRHEHWEGPDSMYVHFTSDKTYPEQLAESFLP